MKFTLKLFVTIGIVGAIIWQLGGVKEVGEIMVRMDVFFLLLAILVSTADRALMTYKWILLLRSREAHLSFFKGMKIYCASRVWGLFLPATVGKDAIRVVSTTKAGIEMKEVVASIIIERFIGFLSALILSLLSLALLSSLVDLDSQFTILWWVGGAVLLGGIIVFYGSFSEVAFALVHERILCRFQHYSNFQKLKDFHETYRVYKAESRVLASFSGLTF